MSLPQRGAFPTPAVSKSIQTASPIRATNKIRGQLAFASPPADAAMAPFAGTLLLDVQSSSDDRVLVGEATVVNNAG